METILWILQIYSINENNVHDRNWTL